MAKNKAQNTNDFFTFVGKSDDRALPSDPERDLAAELYRKGYQRQNIDSYEKSLGVNPVRPKKNLKYRHKILSTDFDKDAAFYDELLNNPRYEILKESPTWTMEGLYKIAIIYSENMDFKTEDEKLKEISENE